MDVRVNKWLDLADRAGWTAIQAAIGVIAATAATGSVDWDLVLISSLTAAAAAAVKVTAAQNVGTSGLGDAIPGRSVVVEPPPPPPPAPPPPPTQAAAT